MKHIFCRITIFLAIAAHGLLAYAESSPIALPGDPKIVVFQYDPNNSYKILTTPLAATNIELSDDEEVVNIDVGDTVQWKSNYTPKQPGRPGIISIRPSQPDIWTAGSIITTRRTYLINLASVPQSAMWYHKVSWNDPGLILLQNQMVQQEQQVHEQEKKRLDNINVTRDISIEKINFDYEIKGDASFRPRQVLDDGRFTWIRMPDTQDLPAVFLQDADGKMALVNYLPPKPGSDYIIIERIAEKFILKLGEDSVTIVNRAHVNSSPAIWPFK